MATKRCPQCNAEYELNQKFCSIDGAVLRGPDAGEQLEGTIIGGREVMRQLGEGGMGFVYLARSVRTGRLDALKMMRPELAKSAEAVSRFNREAMNAARLQHPNVAIVYDVGDTEDGVPYLAMEYIDGESLQQALDRVSLFPPQRAARIIRQVAEALGAAHQLGIIHRDLKPGNVMLARHGTVESVKLVDFGISKLIGAAEQQLTSSGIAIGSPAYMSPEQVVGEADLTPRSDIYSLALTAYTMLTGRLPFDGTGSEVMLARMSEPPLSLATVRPDGRWTSELERVVAKGLSRRPEDRHASALEFASEFESAVGELPDGEATIIVDAGGRKGAPPRRRRFAWLRQGRTAWIAAAGAASLAVASWIATSGEKGIPDTSGSATLGDTATGGVATGGARPGTPSPASGPPVTVPNRAPGRSITFSPPSLQVRAASLPSALRASVDSAIRVVARSSRVTVVGPETSGADVDLSVGADNRIAARGEDARSSVVAPSADSVLAYLRYVIAGRDLAGLMRGALRGDLMFTFDQPGSAMYVGDSFRFRLRSLVGGYVTIVDIAPSGRLSVLVPNTAAADTRQLAPGVEVTIPERTRTPIATGPPAGPGQLWALVTPQPLTLPAEVSQDAANAAAQIRAELTRIVRAGNAPWSVVALRYELLTRR